MNHRRSLALLLTLALVAIAVAQAPLPARATEAGFYATPNDAVTAFFNGLADGSAVDAGRPGVTQAALSAWAAAEFTDILAGQTGNISPAPVRADIGAERATVWVSLPASWTYTTKVRLFESGGAVQYRVWSPGPASYVYRFDLKRVGLNWLIDSVTRIYPYTVSDAKADITVDPEAGSLAGKVSMQIRSDTDNLTGITLPLDRGLKVSSATWSGGSVTCQPARDSDLLDVVIPAIAAGQAGELVVTYEGKLSAKDAGTGRPVSLISRDGSFFAAQLGLPEWQAADLTVRVPNGMTASAGGEFLGREDGTDGHTTFRFRTNPGQVLPAVAVAAYESVERVANGVPVRLNLLPESAARKDAVFAAVGSILQFYQDRLGAFPLAGLSVSETRERQLGYATRPVNQVLVPRIPADPENDQAWVARLAREIAGQWWGNAIQSNHPFDHYALTAYTADLYIRGKFGEAAFQAALDGHRKAYLPTTRYSSFSKTLVFPGSPSDRLFATIIRDKGALVLNMLRGEIGDEAFGRALGDYAREFRGRVATPYDFVAIAQRDSGTDLSGFYDNWFGRPSKLDLSIENYHAVRDNDGWKATFVIANPTEAYVRSVDVRLEGCKPGLVRIPLLTGAETEVSIRVNVWPRRILLDPSGNLPDASRFNNRVGAGLFERGSAMRPIVLSLLGLIIAVLLASSLISVIRRHGWRTVKNLLDKALDYGGSDSRQQTMDFDPDKVKINVDYSALPTAEQVVIERPDLWHDGIASILATDVGSTTTKAILWEKDASDEFVLRARAEAPTTVESPWEDVTLGLRSAIEKIESLTGRQIIAEGVIVSPPRAGVGVDLFISTSSAGGGLQIAVAGVMSKMTADSAQRAASSAGGIVTDVMCLDDNRLVIDRVQRLRQLRPDIILLSGGTDGGEVSHVVNLAEQIALAAPTTRLGGMKTPLVYAGDATARPHVIRLLDGLTSLHIVDNIRPILERENLEPARQMIHKLFMEHVMSQAPGYSRLMEWARNALLPTPGAVGRAVEAFGNKYAINIAAFDIGGATTDVFSLYNGKFERSVSANLGMSYSATNVLAEATPANVLRWLPFALSEADIEDWAANKMIRPTGLPDTLEDLLIEQALAREALRLSLRHHQSALGRLRGVSQTGDGQNIFTRSITVGNDKTPIDMQAVDVLIGSGGVLSHAPRREQTLLMMLDALQPEGFTELFVDSIFMSPQLGLLSTIRAELAAQILERDGLLLLGSCVAPVGRRARTGRRLARVVVTCGDKRHEASIVAGKIARIPLEPGVPVRVKMYPRRGYDCGAGPGHVAEAVTEAGLLGLILDGRGRRPLQLPANAEKRAEAVQGWMTALSAYDGEALKAIRNNRGRV